MRRYRREQLPSLQALGLPNLGLQDLGLSDLSPSRIPHGITRKGKARPRLGAGGIRKARAEQAGERARPTSHTNCARASSYSGSRNSSEPGYIPAMLRKELVIPPEAAQAFVQDMRAFFKAKGQLMQDEIAAKQLWLLQQH